MAEFVKTTDQAGQADRLPRHIAIIMDGNGRWATKRGLPRTAGHKAGAETFRRIATHCKNIGVQYLTVYADGKAVYSVKKRILTPGEMVNLPLNDKMMAAVRTADKITVAVTAEKEG